MFFIKIPSNRWCYSPSNKKTWWWGVKFLWRRELREIIFIHMGLWFGTACLRWLVTCKGAVLTGKQCFSSQQTGKWPYIVSVWSSDTDFLFPDFRPLRIFIKHANSLGTPMPMSAHCRFSYHFSCWGWVRLTQDWPFSCVLVSSHHFASGNMQIMRELLSTLTMIFYLLLEPYAFFIYIWNSCSCFVGKEKLLS